MSIDQPKDPLQITSTEAVFPGATVLREEEGPEEGPEEGTSLPLVLLEDGPFLSTLLVAGDLDDLVELQRRMIRFMRCAMLDPFLGTVPSIHRLDLEGKPAFLCYYSRSTGEFEDAAVMRAAIQQLSEERFKAKGQEVLDSMAADLASMAPRVEVVPGEALGGLGGKR